MNNEPKRMPDDQLIEKLVVQLRDEIVPAVPPQLLEWESETASLPVRRSRRKSMLAWVLGAAVTVLAMVGVANMMLPQQNTATLSEGNQPAKIRGDIAIESPKIHVQNLVTLRPFENLEREIEDMRSEIEQLKTEAHSLDAIRKIDAMMAKN